MDYVAVFGACAVAIVVVMLVTWGISLVIHDVSIVDPVWGLGFVVVAWTARVVADGDGVVVVPRERADQVARYAAAILQQDKAGRRELYEQLGLPPDDSVR